MAHAPEQVEASGPSLPDPASLARVASAGLLAWIVPGLGHLLIGDRARGIICMATIILTFWSGVAIGGVRSTVDPRERSLWFLAQSCTGVNAVGAYLLRPLAVNESPGAGKALAGQSWVAAEIGVHYTGVAGLLNILVILDAMARAELVTRAQRRQRRGPPLEGG